MNIALITLDSLRYDSSQIASTPNFDQLAKLDNQTSWVKVYAHGTYTLPAHIAMFQDGHLPSTTDESIPHPYNRNKKIYLGLF